MTTCPHCKHRFEEPNAKPGPNWTGRIICPKCGCRFRPEASTLATPTTPRHGKTTYFPRKPSSFATTDLTGADAAMMEATVRRDFGRFLGGRR